MVFVRNLEKGNRNGKINIAEIAKIKNRYKHSAPKGLQIWILQLTAPGVFLFQPCSKDTGDVETIDDALRLVE